MRQEQDSAAGNEARHAILEYKIDLILQRLGEPDSSGTGGTGIVGDIARTNARIKETNARVDHLFRLKYIGVGILITIGGTAFLLVAGLKGIITDWMPKSPPGSG